MPRGASDTTRPLDGTAHRTGMHGMRAHMLTWTSSSERCVLVRRDITNACACVCTHWQRAEATLPRLRHAARGCVDGGLHALRVHAWNLSQVRTGFALAVLALRIFLRRANTKRATATQTSSAATMTTTPPTTMPVLGPSSPPPPSAMSNG